jgi:hypothetical protein
MPDAFLDSTALNELVFRHREARSRVELSVPTDNSRLTSRYVLFVIARGYLRSLILLHNRAHAVQSLHQLHEYMHAGQQLFKPYRRGTMLGAYEDFLVHLENLGLSLTEEQRLSHFRGWLALHLRRGWRALSRVAEIINRVGCREDIPPPTPKANGLYEQRLPSAECGLAKACGLDPYLSEHMVAFRVIANGLAALEARDPETERRILALRRLLARPAGSNFVGKDCWSCGDAIICHESPSDATVVTKNRKHFEPLCVLIERTLITYS